MQESFRRLSCGVVLAVVVAAFYGCRTNKDILNDYEKAMVLGDYSSPVAEIEEKADDGGVDELMWRLHAGGSRYLMNDFLAATIQFDKAEDVFIRNDQTSVFKQGGDGAFAMLSNDRAFPYSGGGEDRIFTCFYKAVDYARNGQTDAARTELNRAAQHQDNWLWERKKEIEAAAERLKEDSDAYAKEKGGTESANGADASKSEKAVAAAFANEGFSAQIKEKCGFNSATDGNVETLARKDWLNRYVQYATGVFRLVSGDGDSEAFFRELAEIDPGNALVQSDLALARSGNKPQDFVWVFVEDGLGPVREEWRLDLPTVIIPYLNRYILYAGMALPYLRYRNAACSSYALSAGGQSYPLVEIQDVDSLMKTEFDVYFRGALVREITRTVVKVGVQVALGVVAEKCGGYTGTALKASQVAAAAWAAAVTQADLRCWAGLPKKVFAMRANRPADGRVVISGGGAPIAEVTLPAGNSLVFVRKPAAQASAVVKVVQCAESQSGPAPMPTSSGTPKS